VLAVGGDESRQNGRTNSEQGLTAIMLVIVGAWALSVFGLLGGILVHAKGIQSDVHGVTGDLGEITNETEQVKLTKQINQTASDILAIAKPLPANLEKIQASATHIQGNVDSVKGTVLEINGVAKDISATAGGIAKTAETIKNDLVATGKVADEINGRAKAIFGDVNTASDGAKTIEAGLTKAVGQIDGFIGILESLKVDVGNILTSLGTGHTTPDGKKTIHGHANSIECNADVLATFAGFMPASYANEACG